MLYNALKLFFLFNATTAAVLRLSLKLKKCTLANAVRRVLAKNLLAIHKTIHYNTLCRAGVV